MGNFLSTLGGICHDSRRRLHRWPFGFGNRALFDTLMESQLAHHNAL